MEAYGDFALIYDQLINEDINYKEYAKFILEQCKINDINFNNYLDLACGSGNLTFEIYKNFKHSYGIDLSEEMLCIAQDKIVNMNFRPKFLNQDITEFKVNETFDLITCCLDSINYIIEEDGLKSMFKRAYNSLNDNGIFIFDINSYYKITEILGNNIYSFDNDDVFYCWNNTLNDDIVTMELTFFIKEEDDIYTRVDEVHKERGYSEEKIEALIKQCNFHILKKVENYTDKDVTEKSERIVYIIKKAQQG
ncbi:class I SAM-dependent methyltransferase [Clostridium bornimense]|mgnify:CR=1 FL=1|uniref:class I SAM-dependent DNA methyltransferase n=1 Tax=Clostridium bornimense TaxID=1216932 RepID=UPI001C113292|nr:class I SAM-dependent methyltransferase [Clostridium bornimense]MBU5317696.1 class I SAM-dependent methyltransferase [Clostridium bornimense]